MSVHNQLLPKTHKSFRFGTGHILTLTEDQINKIPYLAAFVSSADFLENAHDDQGHFIIHPKIDIKPLRFILDWFPCRFIRDIFIHLPEDCDTVSTILHMDYLGLLSHSDPSLDEIDSSFFDIVVYNPLNNSYVEKLRPSQMCDMAVRFAIALIREAYDSTDDKVHDRIYWYVMFIISAFRLFDPNIRHHVYKVTKHYFSLFKPCLIRRLNQLQSIQDKYAQMNRTQPHDRFSELKQAEEKNLISLIDTHSPKPTLDLYFPLFLDFHDSYNYLENINSDLFPRVRTTTTETLLEPLYKALVEIIYDRLQNQMCQYVRQDVRESSFFSGKLRFFSSFHSEHRIVRAFGKDETKRSSPFVSQSFTVPQNDSLGFSTFVFWSNDLHYVKIQEVRKKRQIACHIIKQRMIWELFADEVSKEETQYLIMNGLSHLKPQLEQEHHRIIHEIQTFQAERETVNTNNHWRYRSLRSSSVRFERKQEEALVYELLLDQLNQPSRIIVEICEHLLEKLIQAVENQITGWIDNTFVVYVLVPTIAGCNLKHTQSALCKILRRDHREYTYKPTLRTQLNFSRNRFR
ncbi:hypothetical protein I4U23_011187 [Adineta vaga]|nr:hypothetical protein I4U23_011187 [Adineta vaga]